MSQKPLPAVRATYPLDNPAAVGQPRTRRERRALGRYATLMIRPVRRDGKEIVRHVVREVRDEEHAELAYDTHLAAARFVRNNEYGSDDGDGTLVIESDDAAIAALPAAERDVVRGMLADIEDQWRHRMAYVTGDRFRTVLRQYAEHLRAVRLRGSGGVYFVHVHHADTLAALREVTARFGGGSHLVRIPLPHQDEMREMVIDAFTSKAKDDLNQLARDVATAQSRGDAGTATATQLHRRFLELQQTTAEHAELLSTSLDDTTAALTLVQMQLGTLLTAAPAESDDSDDSDQDDVTDHPGQADDASR